MLAFLCLLSFRGKESREIRFSCLTSFLVKRSKGSNGDGFSKKSPCGCGASSPPVLAPPAVSGDYPETSGESFARLRLLITADKVVLN